MSGNLRFAQVTSVVALALLAVGAYTFLPHTNEKYCAVVAAVQPKAVMIEVPSIAEQLTFTMTDKGMEIHQSTVPMNYLGSGVIIHKHGLVLSCAHVFSHDITGPIVATLSNGSTVQALLLYSDKEKDLALLKIKGSYDAANLAEGSLRLGQEVIAVGNPEGQQFSTSHGIISHLGRDIGEPFTFTQIDAPINGGNSGGPLFNLNGELIGINARAWRGNDGMALAIAPATFKDFLRLFEIY